MQLFLSTTFLLPEEEFLHPHDKLDWELIQLLQGDFSSGEPRLVLLDAEMYGVASVTWWQLPSPCMTEIAVNDEIASVLCGTLDRLLWPSVSMQ